MTVATQTDEIGEVIVELVLVNVMDMKFAAPFTSLLSALLACPMIPIFDFPGDRLPFGGVRPLGNAALPLWILFFFHGTAQSQRLPLRSDCDFKFGEVSADGRRVCMQLIRYLLQCFSFDCVLSVEPFSVIQERGMMVPQRDKHIPFVFSLVPLHGLPASASARGRGISFLWEASNWLCSFAAGEGFFGCSSLHAMPMENGEDVCVGSFEETPYRLCSCPCSIRQSGSIQTNNLMLGKVLLGRHFQIISSGVM